MAKVWDEFPLKRATMQKLQPTDGRVRVRFVVECIHTGLPFKPGDEIMVESHWADSIERIGSGHRVTDNNKES